jgi:hypothetical protein
LADGLAGREEYKAMMAVADRLRQDDRAGRGNLSLTALISFATWFLTICIDQVRFMQGCYDLASLADRLARYVAVNELRPEALPVLKALLTLGEIPRGAVPTIIGASESTGFRLTRQLIENGIVGSDRPNGPLSLRFGSATHDILFPKLFDLQG